MLIMFECMVVGQRVGTLMGLHSLSVGPYPTQCYRDGKWVEVQTDELLPGDVDSPGECLHSPKVVFILIHVYSLQPVKHIRIPKPPFLLTCYSSMAGVLSMMLLV